MIYRWDIHGNLYPLYVLFDWDKGTVWASSSPKGPGEDVTAQPHRHAYRVGALAPATLSRLLAQTQAIITDARRVEVAVDPLSGLGHAIKKQALTEIDHLVQRYQHNDFHWRPCWKVTAKQDRLIAELLAGGVLAEDIVRQVQGDGSKQQPYFRNLHEHVLSKAVQMRIKSISDCFNSGLGNANR